MFFTRICSCLFFALLLLAGGFVYAGAKPEKARVSARAERTEISAAQNSGMEGIVETAGTLILNESGNTAERPGRETKQEAPPEPTRAELIMKALSAAYPTRVGEAEFRDGDWAVQVYGKWFYYAEGRLLPEELRGDAGDYSSYPFYRYQETLPPWKEPSEEESARMRGMRENRRRNPRKRSQHFFDSLWRAGNRTESWDRVKTIRFLGFPVMVHYSVMEPLSLVEEKILLESKTNQNVRQWINDLNSVESWNWRNIAESSSRSFHSYGAAIDLLPKSTKGLATYWLWSADSNPEWWKVPYSKRLHPPDEVVRAFESYGFIWGGKWTVYDTMHFEYRPEILIFSKIPLARFR